VVVLTIPIETTLRLFSGKRPNDLGVTNGRLKPAPNSPNAVSSQAQDPGHAIAPLLYNRTRDQAMQALVKIIESTPRTRIVTRTQDYVYAEYTSAVMGFVDDVEFYFEPGSQTIQVRSASRLGYRDFGVNRARIEDIRRWLAASGA
jgi:uncharacterized protein (DUF1499 family)